MTIGKRDIPRRGGLAVVIAVLLVLLAVLIVHEAVARETAGLAMASRDPLLPPAAVRAAAATSPAASSPADGRGPVTSIIVSDGQPTLVVGSRRLRRGDRLDGERIVRIDDSGYWLHDGLKSRRIDLFPGVRKQRAAPPAARPDPMRSLLRAGGPP